jgi:hypothetical protein
MASGEHLENTRLVALEARDLKETVYALRSEIEKAHQDCDARLLKAVDAANSEILHLRATIRRLREGLEATRIGTHEWGEATTVKTSAEILLLETPVKRTNVDPKQTGRQRDHCIGGLPAERRPILRATEPAIMPTSPMVCRSPSPDKYTVRRASPPSDGELAELRETIVRLRDRLDTANAAWDKKMKAIESAGRSKRRELEETIKLLRERLQIASVKG